MLLNIPLSFDLLEIDLVESFVRNGQVVVSRSPKAEAPFRARLHANADGPEFDGSTLQVAVSAAWAYGIHHTGETEDTAVRDGMLDMAEALATGLDVDIADVYDTAMKAIGDIGLDAPHVDPSRWPLLAAEDERRAVATLPH